MKLVSRGLGGGSVFVPGPLLSGVGGNNNDTVSDSPTLGDMIYGDATPLWHSLPGNTLTSTTFLKQVGAGGGISGVPFWAAIALPDLPPEEILKQASWTFPNPVAGSYFYVEVPWDLDLTTVQASTDTGTVDVQIQQTTTPGVAGSAVLSAVLVADNNGQATSGFSIATLTGGRFLQIVLSNVTGAPTQLSINLQGTLD